LHGQLERADNLGRPDVPALCAGVTARSVVAPDYYPGIKIVPVPLLVLDTQLLNYPRMSGSPTDRLPNIHLLRLRNGLRRFVG
jgi:hypothetical protein